MKDYHLLHHLLNILPIFEKVLLKDIRIIDVDGILDMTLCILVVKPAINDDVGLLQWVTLADKVCKSQMGDRVFSNIPRLFYHSQP